MSDSLIRDLFVDAYCEDCRHSEYDSDRDEYYCHIDGKYRGPDDKGACSNFSE